MEEKKQNKGEVEEKSEEEVSDEEEYDDEEEGEEEDEDLQDQEKDQSHLIINQNDMLKSTSPDEIPKALNNDNRD